MPGVVEEQQRRSRVVAAHDVELCVTAAARGRRLLVELMMTFVFLRLRRRPWYSIKRERGDGGCAVRR